jgi:MYXO-CTERM domain-containing protein
MERLFAITLGLAALGTASALAEPLPIDLKPYTDNGRIGQTVLFYADVSEACRSTVRMVTIRDRGADGGSSGVFSGFDLDFLVFDGDGDITTTDDWIRPVENHLTEIAPGTVRKESGSPYQPTETHPGPLFGVLDGEGDSYSVDYGTATLGELDASYYAGVNNLSVDTSHGWVSLGDGGEITVQFPVISTREGERMYLFLGDAGERDETSAGNVDIIVSDEPLYVPMEGLRFYLKEGQSVRLDGAPEGIPPDVESWEWDLDGDTLFDDGVGPSLTLDFDFFKNTMGLIPGEEYHLRILETVGGETRPGGEATIVIPDPASWLLLAAAAPLLRRRRRRERYG